jgi:hypothetical protein
VNQESENLQSGHVQSELTMSVDSGEVGLLTEFDQSTIANMTAALEYVCKKIPADKDSREFRWRIANAMVEYGQSGRRAVVDFQNAGMEVLQEVDRPPRFNWFGVRAKRPK